MNSTFITFPCPTCFHEMFANHNFVGRSIRCACCGNSREVPPHSIPYTRDQEKKRDSYRKSRQSNSRSDSRFNSSEDYGHSGSSSGAGKSDSRNKENDSEYRHSTAVPKDEKYYGSILGLKGAVTFSDVQRIYKQLVLQYHPDRVSHLGPKLRLVAEQEMKEINAAYQHFKSKYGKVE